MLQFPRERSRALKESGDRNGPEDQGGILRPPCGAEGSFQHSWGLAAPSVLSPGTARARKLGTRRDRRRLEGKGEKEKWKGSCLIVCLFLANRGAGP